MHILTSRIQSTLKQNNVALKDRARMTELMVAEAVSACLPIPSSAVENPTGHYVSQHKVNVIEKLAYVNEHIVVDIDAAEQLVLQLWLTRYRLTTPSPRCILKWWRTIRVPSWRTTTWPMKRTSSNGRNRSTHLG